MIYEVLHQNEMLSPEHVDPRHSHHERTAISDAINPTSFLLHLEVKY